MISHPTKSAEGILVLWRNKNRPTADTRECRHPGQPASTSWGRLPRRPHSRCQCSCRRRARRAQPDWTACV